MQITNGRSSMGTYRCTWVGIGIRIRIGIGTEVGIISSHPI